MPNKKPATANKNLFGNLTFIRWQMTAEQKKQYAAEAKKTPLFMMDNLDTLLLSGYKMSLSYDDGNDTHICTITCKPTNTKSPNIDLAFSTRAKTAVEAMDMALYKHYHLCVDECWARDDDDFADIG